MILPAVVSGLVAVDRTAFGQSFLAHPLVAATGAGALAGDVTAGLWAGISLSFFAAEHIPVGEMRLRDWSTVAVATAFAVAGRDDATKGCLLLIAALAALPGGLVIGLVREGLGRLRGAVDDAQLAERPGLVTRFQGGGVALHALRGVLVGTLLYLLLNGLADAGAPGGALGRPCTLFWRLAPVAALPVLFRLHVEPRLRGRRAAGSGV